MFEWEYLKTSDTRVLLKPLIVPATFGGLSGAPVLDSEGQVVGVVSNDTTDPVDGKMHFSPCSLESLRRFLQKQPR